MKTRTKYIKKYITKIKGGIRRIKDEALLSEIKNLFNDELSEDMAIYDLTEKESKLLLEKIQQPIPESCRNLPGCSTVCNNTNLPTYLEIFKMIEKIDANQKRRILIFGGAIRDYVQTNYKDIHVLNDIDINFKPQFEKLITYLNGTESSKRENVTNMKKRKLKIIYYLEIVKMFNI